MECLHCGGTLKRGRATFTDTRNGYTLVLHDLPAWLCGQCGEPLFDSKAVDHIQAAMRSIDEQLRELKAVA